MQVETSDQVLMREIEKLPLIKRIGQLMIFGFATTTPDAHIRKLISEYGIGGVNLLKRNVRDAAQVGRLTTSLQALAKETGLPTLFIATDQEGGTVNRFAFLAEKMAQKDIKNTDVAFTIGKKRAVELRNLGVNMNFSPVLDFVPDTSAYLYARTFASTTDAIAALGVALARGYETGGVIPVFKHFPGYGSVISDPHRNGVVGEDVLLEKSLRPFQLALAELPHVPVMTAHIVYPFVDALPATRSRKFITELLRQQWHYDGVVITDDIEMSSVLGGKITPEEASIQALEAGADMIISTYTVELHEKIIQAVERAIYSGRLSERRINESVLRVWRLKL